MVRPRLTGQTTRSGVEAELLTGGLCSGRCLTRGGLCDRGGRLGISGGLSRCDNRGGVGHACGGSGDLGHDR